MVGVFLAESKFTPQLKKQSNVKNILSNGVYSISISLFLILATAENKISKSVKENLIGYPLIILISALNLYNVVSCLMIAFKSMREKCKNKKSAVSPSEIINNKAKVEKEQLSVVENGAILNNANEQVLPQLKNKNPKVKVKSIKPEQVSKIDKTSKKKKNQDINAEENNLQKIKIERKLMKISHDESQANLANQSQDMQMQISENRPEKPRGNRGFKKPLGRKMRASNNLRKIL